MQIFTNQVITIKLNSYVRLWEIPAATSDLLLRQAVYTACRGAMSKFYQISAQIHNPQLKHEGRLNKPMANTLNKIKNL
jgi:hypothetical protein